MITLVTRANAAPFLNPDHRKCNTSIDWIVAGHDTRSWIKGTLWGTLGFDPRFLKGSIKSFYHAKMLVGAY